MNELNVLISLINKLYVLGYMSDAEVYASNIAKEKLTELLKPKQNDTKL